jgi:hypothetical protein
MEQRTFGAIARHNALPLSIAAVNYRNPLGIIGEGGAKGRASRARARRGEGRTCAASGCNALPSRGGAVAGATGAGGVCDACEAPFFSAVPPVVPGGLAYKKCSIGSASSGT